MKDFVLKGTVCYSIDKKTLYTKRDSCLVCVGGVSAGVFPDIPEIYSGLPVIDYGDNIIMPGLVDLHIHAPQYSFRGLGMDLELLDWLNTHTFPEESKYSDLEYAQKAYELFIEDLKRGPNTRACVYATVHSEATLLLMDLLEKSGLVTMVGKVNMDRNAPESLCEKSASQSVAETIAWLDACGGRFKNTYQILTPRFIPSCSDELMRSLGEIKRDRLLPVQSHLSENQGEIEWVRELCPEASCYGDAYRRFGLFEENTIMAHCTWSGEEETEMMLENGVFVAHCPQSNINLSSGIAPIRLYMDRGLNVGLGSDVAGGCHTSILRAMSDAISVSKLRWRLVDNTLSALTLEEAFYLGTMGGGAFFGKCGSFESGYEFDAVVVDDSNLRSPFDMSPADRLARIVYFSDDRNIKAKFVRGEKLDILDI